MPSTTTATSDSPAVDAYMSSLAHPLKDVVVALRAAVLSAHESIGEEVKWNAPAFFYTGPMAPFSAKEFRRHLAVCNLPPRKDSIRLVFLRAGTVADPSGLLEGSYPDGRRIATFRSVADVKAAKKALVAILQAQLDQLGVSLTPGRVLSRADRRRPASPLRKRDSRGREAPPAAG